MANAAGGRLTAVDLTVTGADRVAFDRLYAYEGRVTTDATVVGIERGWVSRELALYTPSIDLLVKNDALELQDGFDTQLYASDRRFRLLQLGRLTFTDAHILRFGRVFGSGMDTRGSGFGLTFTDLSAESAGAGGLLSLSGTAEYSLGSMLEAIQPVEVGPWGLPERFGPHFGGAPAVRATFDCAFPFVGAGGAFEGALGVGTSGCGLRSDSGAGDAA